MCVYAGLIWERSQDLEQYTIEILYHHMPYRRAIFVSSAPAVIEHPQEVIYREVTDNSGVIRVAGPIGEERDLHARLVIERLKENLISLTDLAHIADGLNNHPREMAQWLQENGLPIYRKMGEAYEDSHVPLILPSFDNPIRS
jgi:hypothetical protein